MKRIAVLIAAFLVTGAVRDLQSVKSEDYQTQPKTIAVTEVPFGFVPEFRDSLARKLAECGVGLSFFPVADADAQLQIRQTGRETETVSRPYQQYTRLIRYEFTLVESASHKNVWKSQGDFVLDKPKENEADQRKAMASRSDDWADEMVYQMRRDKLIAHCGSSVAIAPPTPPQPQAVPAPPQVASATPQAAPAPDGPVKPMRFNLNGVTYNSLEEAEPQMRGAAAGEVAALALEPGAPHAAVLMVLPPDKTPVAPTVTTGSAPPPADVLQMLKLVGVINRVGTEASIDALRKSNLFTDVQVLRGDDVAAEDFRGQPYKLYLAPSKPTAHWTLAKQGGESKALPLGPGGLVTQDNLHKWLNGVKDALTALGG